MLLSDFVALVESKRSASFVSVVARRSVRLTKALKAEHGFGEVSKLVRFRANLNLIAEKKLKVHDLPEGYGFPSWGTVITRALVEHKGNHYLRFVDPKFESVEYFENGKPVSGKRLAALQAKFKPSEKPIKCLQFGIKPGDQYRAFGKTITIE